MTEQYPITQGRLVDVVNHLRPGARITSTKDIEAKLGTHLENVSILQACAQIIRAGLQDKEAELSCHDDLIFMNSGWIAFPLEAFTITYTIQEAKIHV